MPRAAEVWRWVAAERGPYDEPRRADVKWWILGRAFPRAPRERRLLGITLEMRSRGTTSGVEYIINIYRFARWDYRLVVWRAG